jgi:DNA primase
MPGRIRDEDITLLRERVSIVDVVSDHVTLKPAGGGNLKGLCPFHDEKTPSFQVSPGRGYYHCFGCDKGGDVFAFLQEIEHLTYVEAVQRLAERANITLTVMEGGTSTRSERGTRPRLLAANKAAAEFYAAQLTTEGAQTARTFLTDRGFDLDAAAHFGCGYAQDGWDKLV